MKKFEKSFRQIHKFENKIEIETYTPKIRHNITR